MGMRGEGCVRSFKRRDGGIPPSRSCWSCDGVSHIGRSGRGRVGCGGARLVALLRWSCRLGWSWWTGVGHVGCVGRVMSRWSFCRIGRVGRVCKVGRVGKVSRVGRVVRVVGFGFFRRVGRVGYVVRVGRVGPVGCVGSVGRVRLYRLCCSCRPDSFCSRPIIVQASPHSSRDFSR